MKKNFILFGCLLLALFFFLNFLFRSVQVEQQPESTRPQVSASIFPLYDLVRTIGNTVVDVQLILPPGASPHTYELNPQTVKTIEQSQRVFVIGYGIDDWILPFVNDSSRLIRVDQNVELKDSNDADEGPIDPHYWLDVSNAMKMAQTIAEELTQLQPDQADIIQTNLEDYLSELTLLDTTIKDQLSQLPEKNLLTFHDAWFYFADAYGLTVVGTFEPEVGREPTPQYLVDLAKTVQSEGLKTIYAEPQFSSSVLQSFLSDYNIHLAVLDPIGGSATTDTYIHLIQSNVQTITQNQ